MQSGRRLRSYIRKSSDANVNSLLISFGPMISSGPTICTYHGSMGLRVAIANVAAHYANIRRSRGGAFLRICIDKSENVPELTLLTREGLPVSVHVTGQGWTKIKVVTDGEMRTDLLVQMGDAGYSVVKLSSIL